MSVLRLFLVALFITTNAYSSECGLSDSVESICEKNKKVTSLEALNTYLSNYGEKNGSYRNLVIDFDISSDVDLSIHSPCRITFKKLRSHSVKNICVNGREGVYFQNDIAVNANNISLYSKKRIAIRHHAGITAKDLKLISNGDGLDSRVHIRHNSQIKVDNLTLEADARSTLGHTSTYTIANSLNVSSNIEFSAIWRNSTVTAQSVNILSNNKNLFSKNTSINSPVMNLSAPECNTSKLTTSGNAGGNCSDVNRPIAKLSRSAKEINSGESVSFSAKKSSDNLGITKYSFFVNSELVRSNQNPEFLHKFIESGIYYVQVVVEDADGYKASTKRKVIVNETLVKSGSAYFDYRIEDNNLSLVFHQMIPYEEITSAKYLITPLDEDEGVYEFPITNFYHRSEKLIGFLGDGEYKVALIVTDIYNREFIYERVVNYTGEESFYKNSPIVEFEITPVSPKEIMVDFRKIFDPSNKLQWIDIEWGDGSVEEVNHVTSAFVKHKYSNVGDFEIKLIVAKEIDGEESLSEFIRTVTITNDEVATLPPLIDYGILIEDFAPYVTFNLDRSISPNAEITSVVFDHGDGSFYSGDSFVHTHFYDPGVYVTKLTVTDSNGLTVTQSSQVVITDPSENLVASLNCEQIDDPLNVECEVVAVDKFSELSEITLDWGDGTTESIPLLQGEFTWDSFEHTYADEGTYNTILTVKNIRAETKSSQYSIILQESVEEENQPPHARIYCQATGNTKEIMCDYSGSDDPDGYITNFNIKISDGSEYNSANSGPIIHTLSSNGLFQVLLTVTDDKGAESTQETTIEIINQPPVVDVICESNSAQELSCTSYSYDPDGYIVNTKFDWGEGSQSGTATSFYTTLSSGGVKDVRVSVNDNEGSTSEGVYTVYVALNQSPVARFSCSSPLIGVLSCGSDSFDPEGGALSFSWNVDGQTYEGNSLSLEELRSSEMTVVLIVTDTFGAISELSKMISIKQNGIPVSVGECLVSDFLKISCNSNGSYDPDGDTLEYIWTLGDIIIGTQSELEYEFLEATEELLTLMVLDPNNGSSVTNIDYSISIPTLDVDIFCKQKDNFIGECVVNIPTGLDDKEIKYQWKIGGEVYSENEILVYTTTEASTNSIEVDISIGNGLIQVNKVVEFSFVEIPNEDLLSLGTLSFVGNEKQLYGLEETLKFSLVGVDPLYSLTGTLENFSLDINGELYSLEESGDFSNGVLSLNNVFSDGLNNIEIIFFDSDGRKIYYENVFIFGSRSLSIDNSENENISVFIYDFDDALIYKEISNLSVIEIDNIPNLNLYYDIEFDNIRRLVHLEKEEGQETHYVDLSSLALPLEINDYNFNIVDSSEGWSLKRGLISNSVDYTNPISGEYRQGVSILPDDDGVIEIESRFSLFNTEEKLFKLPFIKNLNPGDTFISHATNLSTGEIQKNTFHVPDDGEVLLSIINDVVYSQIGDDDDEFLISFYLQTQSSDSFSYNYTDFFIENVYASESPSVRSGLGLFSVEFLNSEFFFKKVRDFQGHRIDEDESLSVLPSAPFPSYYNVKNVEGNIFNIILDIDSVGVFSELNILLCSTIAPSMDNCRRIPIDTTLNSVSMAVSKNKTELTESNLNFDYNFFYFCLEATSLDRKTSISCSQNENGNKFRRMSSLSQRVGSPLRYGSQIVAEDLADGTIDWVSSSHVDLFADLLSRDTIFGRVRYDDAGHVSSYKKEVSIGGHKEHHYGLAIDLRFYDASAAVEVIEKTKVTPEAKVNREPTNSVYDAKAIYDFLNYSDNSFIEEVKLKYKKEDRFENYLDNSCLTNSKRIFRSVLGYAENGHFDHFHLKMIDSHLLGVKTQPSVFMPEEDVAHVGGMTVQGYPFDSGALKKQGIDPVAIKAEELIFNNKRFYNPLIDGNIFNVEGDYLSVNDWREYQKLGITDDHGVRFLWVKDSDCYQQDLELDFSKQPIVLDSSKVTINKEYFSAGEVVSIKMNEEAVTPRHAFKSLIIEEVGSDDVVISSTIEQVNSGSKPVITFNEDLYSSTIIANQDFYISSELKRWIRVYIEKMDGNKVFLNQFEIYVCPLGVSSSPDGTSCQYSTPLPPSVGGPDIFVTNDVPTMCEQSGKLDYSKTCTYSVECPNKWSFPYFVIAGKYASINDDEFSFSSNASYRCEHDGNGWVVVDSGSVYGVKKTEVVCIERGNDGNISSSVIVNCE